MAPAVFEEQEDPANKSFFSEIIASISDVKFTKDGRYIVSRDYLTLKIWDINMESRPVKTIQVRLHMHMRFGPAQPYLVLLFFRFTSICAPSCAICTKMTAFSTSSSALSAATATTW